MGKQNLIYNGTTLSKDSNTIYYDGNDVGAVYYNGTEVYRREEPYYMTGVNSSQESNVIFTDEQSSATSDEVWKTLNYGDNLTFTLINSKNGAVTCYSYVDNSVKWSYTYSTANEAGYTYGDISITCVTESGLTISVTTTTTFTIPEGANVYFNCTRSAVSYAVTINAGLAVNSVFLSTANDATSGSPSGTAYTNGTTVYGYAVINSECQYCTVPSGWTLISGTAGTAGAIYRVGSKTINAGAASFGRQSMTGKVYRLAPVDDITNPHFAVKYFTTKTYSAASEVATAKYGDTLFVEWINPDVGDTYKVYKNISGTWQWVSTWREMIGLTTANFAFTSTTVRATAYKSFIDEYSMSVVGYNDQAYGIEVSQYYAANQDAYYYMLDNENYISLYGYGYYDKLQVFQEEGDEGFFVYNYLNNLGQPTVPSSASWDTVFTYCGGYGVYVNQIFIANYDNYGPVFLGKCDTSGRVQTNLTITYTAASSSYGTKTGGVTSIPKYNPYATLVYLGRYVHETNFLDNYTYSLNISATSSAGTIYTYGDADRGWFVFMVVTANRSANITVNYQIVRSGASVVCNSLCSDDTDDGPVIICNAKCTTLADSGCTTSLRQSTVCNASCTTSVSTALCNEACTTNVGIACLECTSQSRSYTPCSAICSGSADCRCGGGVF